LAHIEVSAEEALQRVTELSVPLERGDLTTDEFISQASELTGYRGTPEFFRNTVADIFELNTPMVQFIEEQKSVGAGLHLLSNTNGIHVPFFEATYPVFDLFNGRVYSHEARLMKPDPEIFAYTIKKLELDPTSTIYIDDKPENVVAGANAGFRAIPYDLNHHDTFLTEVSPLL